MSRVLVVATSRKTRGGITSVIKAHETGEQWKKYHCVWIQTNRDGGVFRKCAYFITAMVEYLILLPFADIVHLHLTLQTSLKRKYIFFKLAKLFKKKTIVHFHPAGEHLFKEEKDLSLAESVFRSADRVLVLSPRWCRLVNQYLGTECNVEVLWNPCPKVQRDISNKKKQILFAGTICKRKGYDVLLKAFGKIAGKYPDWKVVFAGNPYMLDGLNELEDGIRIAKELGISQQVEWLGWVSGADKEHVFNESSVYCLASLGEGFPMGVLDAWAYGIPCVMTPVGGIPDIVKDGVNGLIFPISDVDSLAEKLDLLLSDPQLRDNIVRESDKLVFGEFSVKNVTEHLGRIYKNILE